MSELPTDELNAWLKTRDESIAAEIAALSERVTAEIAALAARVSTLEVSGPAPDAGGGVIAGRIVMLTGDDAATVAGIAERNLPAAAP